MAKLFGAPINTFPATLVTCDLSRVICVSIKKFHAVGCADRRDFHLFHLLDVVQFMKLIFLALIICANENQQCKLFRIFVVANSKFHYCDAHNIGRKVQKTWLLNFFRHNSCYWRDSKVIKKLHTPVWNFGFSVARSGQYFRAAGYSIYTIA